MPRPRRLTPEQIKKALALRAKSWTHRQIAQKLGFDHRTIGRALLKYNQQAREQLVEHAADMKTKQVTQLEAIVAEALKAWEESNKPKIVDRTVTRPDKEGESQLTTTHEESSHHADPSLLNQARGALAEIREVLGINDKANQGASHPVAVLIQGILERYEDRGPHA